MKDLLKEQFETWWNGPRMSEPFAEKILKRVAWDAWRTSVLQAGNSPVIQDSWISCSERMPEDEQEVLTRNRMGHCFVSFFDEHSGLFFDRVDVAAACCIEHILVTHWMPLPAGPDFREISNSSTKHFRETSETSTNAPAIPNGYLLVPVKETLEMAVAGDRVYELCVERDEYPTDAARRIWAAMVAAAPLQGDAPCTK